jgi:hypothetical protein
MNNLLIKNNLKKMMNLFNIILQRKNKILSMKKITKEDFLMRMKITI